MVLHISGVLLLAAFLDVQQPPGAPEDRQVGIRLAARHDLSAIDVHETAPDAVGSLASVSSSEPAGVATVLPAMASVSIRPPVQLPLPGRSPVTPSALFGERRPSGTDSRPMIPSGIDPTRLLAEEAARRDRERARGPTAAVTLFGSRVAEGRTFLFLIDRSKSMGDLGLQALATAEAELVSSLAQLKPNHFFQVMAYHHQCVYLLKDELLAATPENLQAIRGYLSKLAAFGATKHENALRTALTWEPDVLFLLTDGGDPSLTAAQRKLVGRRAAGRTAIHCIHFGFGPPREESNFLSRLADENSGSYRYVDMEKRDR